MTPTMATHLGSLIGFVIYVDHMTISQTNLEFILAKVEIPIQSPLIRGVLMPLENGNPVWVQFNCERIFRVCYNYGCIGHMNHRCLLSFAQARVVIRNWIQAAKQMPNGAFWMEHDRPLYTRNIKAFRNSNLNQTTKLEIIWSEDELKILEMEDAHGISTIFFVQQRIFASSEEDPAENFDVDVSRNTLIEPFDPFQDNQSPEGDFMDVAGSLIDNRTRHFGLDSRFEDDLNDLGLTFMEVQFPVGCK